MPDYLHVLIPGSVVVLSIVVFVYWCWKTRDENDGGGDWWGWQ